MDAQYPTFQTPNGKTIEIYPEGTSIFLLIRFREGGELPSNLKQKFSTIRDAEFAINQYLNQKEAAKAKKEEVNKEPK